MDHNMVENAPEAGKPEEPGKGFLPSLIDIFVDPAKVFARIDSGLEWWKGFIALAVINGVVAWFTGPVQLQLASLNPRGLSEEQLQRMLDGMQRFAWLGPIVAIFFILIALFITAGLTNLIINIVAAKSDFKKTLSLMTFTGLIGSLEQIISIIIIHARGIETIESRADATVSMGLGILFRDAEGFPAALMQSLSVFQIWYFIVFVFGLASIFRISKAKAVAPAIVLWLVGFVFIYLGQKMGGA